MWPKKGDTRHADIFVAHVGAAAHLADSCGRRPLLDTVTWGHQQPLVPTPTFARRYLSTERPEFMADEAAASGLLVVFGLGRDNDNLYS